MILIKVNSSYCIYAALLLIKIGGLATAAIFFIAGMLSAKMLPKGLAYSFTRASAVWNSALNPLSPNLHIHG